MVVRDPTAPHGELWRCEVECLVHGVMKLHAFVGAVKKDPAAGEPVGGVSLDLAILQHQPAIPRGYAAAAVLLVSHSTANQLRNLGNLFVVGLAPLDPT